MTQPAATAPTPASNSTLEEKKALADYYLRAADLHLQRAIALAETEWKVSLAFWAALLASGLSFISYTGRSQPPMIVYIAHSDFLFLIPYLIASFVFVYGFSVNQAESIVSERTLYRYNQNLAAGAINATSGINGDPNLPISITTDNKVWAYKLLSTFLFVSAIWSAAQWLAHGKISTIPGVAEKTKPIWCAFLQCSADNGWPTADGIFWLEWGTVSWIGAAVFVATRFKRAYRGER